MHSSLTCACPAAARWPQVLYLSLYLLSWPQWQAPAVALPAGLAGLQLGSAAPAAGGKGKGKKVVLFGGPQRKY